MDDIRKLWGIMTDSFDEAVRQDATNRIKEIFETGVYTPDVTSYVREKITEYVKIVEWRNWNRNSQFERAYGTDNQGELIPSNKEIAFLSIGINIIPFFEEILNAGDETEIRNVDFVLKSIFLSLKSLQDMRQFEIRLRTLHDILAESRTLTGAIRKNLTIRLAYASGRRCALGDMEAIGNLFEALKDTDEEVRIVAARELNKIKDASAIPALVETLGDNSDRVRWIVTSALEGILRNCKTFNELEKFEKRLMGRFENLIKKTWKHGELTIIRMQFSKLSSLAAKQKNSLVSKRDLLLDDVPKPPKKGGIYRTLYEKRGTRTFASSIQQVNIFSRIK